MQKKHRDAARPKREPGPFGGGVLHGGKYTIIPPWRLQKRGKAREWTARRVKCYAGVIARRGTITRGDPLARQNYGFEKRQKELARQKKQEAKLQRKLNKKTETSQENQEEPLEDLETPAEEEKPE